MSEHKWRCDPTKYPGDCVVATLFELANGKVEDRSKTLDHGLRAAHELIRRAKEAGYDEYD